MIYSPSNFVFNGKKMKTKFKYFWVNYSFKGSEFDKEEQESTTYFREFIAWLLLTFSEITKHNFVICQDFVNYANGEC